MNSNGGLNHDLVAANAIPNIEDGIDHDFRVVWDPLTTTLEVYLDGAFIFTYSEDLVTSYFTGDPLVYFGWTGATGGASNVQSVCIDIESDIEVDDTEVCPGQLLSFTDASTTGLIYNGVGITNWAWSLGDGTTSTEQNLTHTYLAEGDMPVTLTTTNLIGCTDFDFLTISVAELELELTATNPTCFDATDGIAIATPLTGDAPFDFEWDDPLMQTTATAVDLVEGTYGVTVADAMGCSQTGTITLTDPPLLIIDAVSATNATCGLNDAEVEITPTGGTPPYTYQLVPGSPFVADPIFTGVADGTYNFTVADANGCEVIGDVTVNSNDLVVSTTATNALCFEADNGTATAFPEFDVTPCNYVWDDPAGQTTVTATGLAPGTHTVAVTHATIGCSGTASVTIAEPTLLEITAIPVINASCGINNGALSISAIGGTPGYQYSIDGGATYVTSPDFDGLAPGSYTVNVKDNNNCVATQSITIINVTSVPDVVIKVSNPDSCQVHTVTFMNLSDPTLTDITKWSLGNGVTLFGDTVVYSYADANCYDITVEITTYDGCITTKTFEDLICVRPLPIAAFDYSPRNPNLLQPEVLFENQSVGATTYQWRFDDGNTSTAVNPVHSYPEMGNEYYEVRLVATTDYGCRDTAYQSVYMKEVILYYVPNAFTLDNDVFNPTFQPVFVSGFTPANYSLKIFNRWGEVMFESQNPSVGWDGTYGEQVVQEGMYTWQITFKENGTDRRHEDYGHVLLLR